MTGDIEFVLGFEPDINRIDADSLSDPSDCLNGCGPFKVPAPLNQNPHLDRAPHREDLCTFDVIIREYDLTDKALLRMAKVINAADTDRLDADPLAAAFEAIAVGCSLRYPDDLENIGKQFEVYDALYAWCRLNIAQNKS